MSTYFGDPVKEMEAAEMKRRRKEMENWRRLRIYRINSEQFSLLFTNSEGRIYRWSVLVGPPEDAKFISMNPDWQSGSIMFIYEHKSFDPIEPGSIPPTFNIEIVVSEDPQHKLMTPSEPDPIQIYSQWQALLQKGNNQYLWSTSPPTKQYKTITSGTSTGSSSSWGNIP